MSEWADQKEDTASTIIPLLYHSSSPQHSTWPILAFGQNRIEDPASAYPLTTPSLIESLNLSDSRRPILLLLTWVEVPLRKKAKTGFSLGT
jgi:hypothetical protein